MRFKKYRGIVQFVYNLQPVMIVSFMIILFLISVFNSLEPMENHPENHQVQQDKTELVVEQETIYVPKVNIVQIYSDNLDHQEITVTITSLSFMYNIPESILYSIILTESDFDPLAKSRKNCYGLMQLSAIALKEYNLYNDIKYTINDLYDPIINITVGTWYYNFLYNSLKLESYEQGYLAYNIGPTKYRNELQKYNHDNFKPLKRFRSKYNEVMDHINNQGIEIAKI